MNKDFAHAKNDHLYVATKNDIVAQQVCHVVVGKRKKISSFFFVSACWLKPNL
jgi:hypothetical protein